MFIVIPSTIGRAWERMSLLHSKACASDITRQLTSHQNFLEGRFLCPSLQFPNYTNIQIKNISTAKSSSESHIHEKSRRKPSETVKYEERHTTFFWSMKYFVVARWLIWGYDLRIYLNRSGTSSSRHFLHRSQVVASWSPQSLGRDTSPFPSQPPSWRGCFRAEWMKTGRHDEREQTRNPDTTTTSTSQ